MFDHQNSQPKLLKKKNSSSNLFHLLHLNNNKCRVVSSKPLHNHNVTNNSTGSNTPFSQSRDTVYCEQNPQNYFKKNINTDPYHYKLTDYKEDIRKEQKEDLRKESNQTQNSKWKYSSKQHRRLVTFPQSPTTLNYKNTPQGRNMTNDLNDKFIYKVRGDQKNGNINTTDHISMKNFSAENIKPKSSFNLWEQHPSKEVYSQKRQMEWQKIRRGLIEEIERMKKIVKEKRQKQIKLQKQVMGLRNIISNDIMLLTEFQKNQKQLHNKIQTLELKIIEQNYEIRLLTMKNDYPISKDQNQLCLIVEESFVQSLMSSLIHSSVDCSNLTLSQNTSNQRCDMQVLDFKECYLHVLDMFKIGYDTDCHHLLVKEILNIREKNQFLITQLTHAELKVKKLQSFNIPQLSLQKMNSDQSSNNVSTSYHSN